MDTKIIRTAGILLLVLLILGTVIALLFYWNSFILRGLVSDFKSELRAAEGIEIVETVSDYGKLNGNGNGINYFGAVLVKVDNPDVLDTTGGTWSWVADGSSGLELDCYCKIAPQTSSSNYTVLQRCRLTFSKDGLLVAGELLSDRIRIQAKNA